MGALADRLEATEPAPAYTARRQSHKTGREYEWNGVEGFIKTEALAERPQTWDEFIKDAGLDPDEVEVVGDVQVRGWDAAIGGGEVQRMHYYRLSVRRRNAQMAALGELIEAARARPTPTNLADHALTGKAFVLALGDLQLGKVDGDGTEGTVNRFIETTKRAVARYLRIANGHPVYIIHLGDCIEGFVSQGGANAWRTSLTITEQTRLYQQLLQEQILDFAAVAPSVTVVGVPGNHDEANRPIHAYGDSWAIAAISNVRDALGLAGRFEHVKLFAPARDELTLTLDIEGTIVAMAHGHQFGRGPDGWKNWWKGQQHGRQPVGDADLLLCGHYHHLRLEQDAARGFIQVPALESESTWFRHTAGEGGRPGVVTMLVGGGSWSSLEILDAA